MAIKLSRKRPRQQQVLTIDGKTRLAAIGAVELNIPFLVRKMDFFPSGMKVEIDGKLVYIDPVHTGESAKADIILVSHHHQDHYSVQDLRSLSDDRTVIFCPEGVYRRIRKKIGKASIECVEPGDQRECHGLMISFLPAHNKKKRFVTAHPPSTKNVGFVVGRGTFSLYYAGDTDVIEEMNDLHDLTVAIVPIDGGELTMSTEEAIALINRLQPEYAIPVHYAIGSTAPEDFRNGVRGKTKVQIMDGQEPPVAMKRK